MAAGPCGHNYIGHNYMAAEWQRGLIFGSLPSRQTLLSASKLKCAARRCIDMCADTCTDTYTDMCAGKCTDRGAHMCIRTCTGTYKDMCYRYAYGHVCWHVCRHRGRNGLRLLDGGISGGAL